MLISPRPRWLQKLVNNRSRQNLLAVCGRDSVGVKVVVVYLQPGKLVFQACRA